MLMNGEKHQKQRIFCFYTLSLDEQNKFFLLSVFRSKQCRNGYALCHVR